MSTNFAHPLDPLSAEELSAVFNHAKTAWNLTERHLVAMCQLDEPNKADVLAWNAGDELVRAARFAILDRSTAEVFEGVITTSASRPSACRHLDTLESELQLARFRYAPVRLDQ